MSTLPALVIASIHSLIGMKVEIVSPETELAAREYLVRVRNGMKAFKASVVEVKKPFKKEIDEIDAASKPWIEKLQQKDQETEQAILAYVRKVREETERRNQKELEKYEKKVATVEAKAIANNKPMPIVLPPSLASAPVKTVELEGAKQTIVKHKKWRIKRDDMLNQDIRRDLSMLDARFSSEQGLDIPFEFFCLDTGKIGKIIRAGGTIPGIEVYEEESLSQRAV